MVKGFTFYFVYRFGDIIVFKSCNSNQFISSNARPEVSLVQAESLLF
jgi:hypothetical protein